MGTSEGLEGGPGIDCCVGAIVWVRRRNGSWWPGRILGSDELSASHVMSPRSGTPVKLLGREDASVDWYNLEKSKRVKAFRCGEFDECIERAESSQGIPIKKREKYARREDAILHALELEKQNLEKREQKAGTASNHTSYKMPNALRKELGSCSPSAHYSGNDKTRHQSKFISLKTQPHSRGLDLSLKEESKGNPQFAQKVKHAKEQSLEDDNSEAIPRMRGLQDFGLRIAPLKRKFSASVAFGSSQRSASVDSRFHSLPNHVSCGKNFSAIKKRTQGGLTEEPLAKKRDRRRPLVQVLQSSAKLLDVQTMQSDGSTGSIAMQGEKEQADVVYRAKRSRCVYLPVESNDCLDHIESPSDKMQKSPSHFPVDNSLPHLGSLTEDNTSSILIEGESDSGTDHTDSDMDGEAAILSDPRISERSDSQGGTVFRVPEQPGNMDNEELDESELPGYISQLHYHGQAANVSADMGGSNWQLKRKRNIRNSIKRPMESIDGRDSVKRADTCNGRLPVSIYEGKGEDIVKMTRRDGQMALKQGVYHRHEELNNGYDEGDLIENDSRQIQMSGFGNRRYSSMLKAGCNITDSEEDSHEMTLPAWEAGRISQAALRGYREESDDCFDRIYAGHLRARMEPMLLDVDLKVQASYQGERVPLVSLMSRLNGKAIIGHPIQIETMEDGSSDIIFSKDGFYEEPLDSDGNTALPSVWRTARRTTLHRVPHPHPSSALEGEEVNPPQYSDIDSKPPPRKPFHKERFLKNSYLRQPPTENNSPKKILKKSNLSSQKTRTLSSIATDQKTGGKNSNHKLAGKNAEFDVSIKSEKTTPVATCIPVKLVFSRILEAVSRLPLKAATQRISTASLADRNSS